MARDAAAARSAGELAGRLFGPPGWQPDGAGETSDKIRERWQAAARQTEG